MTDVARKHRRISYLDAVREALLEEMRRDPTIFILGEDVRSGLYGVTGGFEEEFGAARVRDTPISESGFCGAAIGAAMTGMRPVVDLTIAAFCYVAMDQLISQAAKNRYQFGGQTAVPVVFRATMFYRGNNAAQSSDRPYPSFMNVPGLKVIVPSNPYDAKGLIKSAIRDDNPVLCFESNPLWNVKGDVPSVDYSLPLGVADVKRPGKDVTVVAIADTVRFALEVAEKYADEGVDIEVIDPRSLSPLDVETIATSVAKTGRLVVVDPAHRTCSAASEICASVYEVAFDSFKTAAIRVTTPQTQVPFSPALESPLFPSILHIQEAVDEVIHA